MKKILVAISILVLAGCAKKTQYTQDLTGTWLVYKLSLFNIQQDVAADTILDDSITFGSNGIYANLRLIHNLSGGFDTSRSIGKWQFQDGYGQLVLSDSANRPRDTFTILNLTGSSVELLRNGFDHYLRKNQ